MAYINSIFILTCEKTRSKKLQKVSYREETFHDHKADKISNLEYSHVSIFGIFHPFTSNFLIGIASKPFPTTNKKAILKEGKIWSEFSSKFCPIICPPLSHVCSLSKLNRSSRARKLPILHTWRSQAGVARKCKMMHH